PMFCVQGSDAHRVRRAPSGTDATHKHGIGDRYFEALLEEPTFAALRELLQSQNLDHLRVPKRDQKQWEIDQLRFGQSTERQILRSVTDSLDLLIRDIAALSNTGGGTLVIGAMEQSPGAVQGVARPEQVAANLRGAVEQNIEPVPMLSLELLRYEGHDVIRVEVSASQLPPYVTREGALYVRRGAETVPATRGEIVQLARRALAGGATSPLDNGQDLELPRSGVEIVDDQRRNGEWLYEIRDLRTTPGVSRDRAQGLWQYAIARHEDLREGRMDIYSQVRWAGRLGLLRAYQQGGRTKFDLVHRDANGVIDHIFYGVSDWGLSEAWNVLLGDLRSPEAETAEPELPTLSEKPRPLNGRDARPSFEERERTPPPVRHEPLERPILTPSAPDRSFGDRKWRWRGRGGIWAITRSSSSQPLFDIAMKHANSEGYEQYPQVPREKLSDAWLRFIHVQRPRTGIEVVNDASDADGIRRISFRDLRNGEISAPWRAEELKEGSVREYAARMHQLDKQLDESGVRWWGNLGYMRPMRSQVDLVYRDEEGVDHIYYAARREELRDEWAQLLAQWPDEPSEPVNNPAAIEREHMQRQPANRPMSSSGGRPPYTGKARIFPPPAWSRAAQSPSPNDSSFDAAPSQVVVEPERPLQRDASEAELDDWTGTSASDAEQIAGFEQDDTAH
ncbi:MAG: ATP-binding protein, partial [Chloroflexi bacterium]|nr:ATP-binding protein [Chloroflexota bacterium]